MKIKFLVVAVLISVPSLGFAQDLSVNMEVAGGPNGPVPFTDVTQQPVTQQAVPQVELPNRSIYFTPPRTQTPSAPSSTQNLPSPTIRTPVTVAPTERNPFNPSTVVPATSNNNYQPVRASSSSLPSTSLPSMSDRPVSMPASTAAAGTSLGGMAGGASNILGSIGNGAESLMGGNNPFGAISKTLGGFGDKLEGSIGNLLNGTLGQGGTAAAGTAAAGGTAGAAGGAGGAAGGAGGAGGAGAAVMDIGNILLSVLQMAQMLQQTGVQTNQLQTLNDQLGVNSQELAVTRAVYDAIGTAPSGGSSSGGGSGGSSGGGSGLSNSLATAVPTSLSSTTGGASSGMASVLQAGGQVGNFIDSKAGSLFDLYSFGQGLMGSIQDFSSDPLGATMDILSMLAGGSPSSKLSNMSAEEMASYGLEVPGALSTQFNGVALQNGQAALDAYAARKARYDSLAAATARSKSLNETAELNTLSSIEGARATSDAVAQSGADAARNAANAELRNQADRKRDLQSDATALLD